MKLHVHWMNLMKNKIIQKFQSSKNFKRKDCKEKDSFFKPSDKIVMFNGFKMFSFRCKSHV